MRFVSPRFLLPLLLLLLPFAAHADPRYTVTAIGTVNGGYSIPFGINETGQVIGTSYTGAPAPDYAFMYSGGTLSNLGSLDGGSSHALNINAAGQVVGFSTLGGSSQGHAFLYDGATMRDLGTLGGQGSSANGINDAGWIVGEAQTSGGDSHAFVYANGRMQDIGTLGGSSSKATEINNAGIVAGSSDVAGFTHAFVYANGAMTDLGTLAGKDNYSYAYAISNAGHVVGSSGFEESPFTHAFLYADGVMTDIGRSLGQASDAFGVNDLGQVVGQFFTPNAGLAGFLYANGVATNLNDLIDPASGWTIYEGSDINNLGQIAAWGYKEGVGTVALRLDPINAVPEPGSTVMLLCGLAAFLFVKRRNANPRFADSAPDLPG